MSSISVKMIKMLEASIPKMLAEVTTHAAISTTHLTPADKNRVIVTADENFEGKRTLYVYDEGTTTWVFVGVVDELPMEIFFTEQRNIYLTTKDRDHIKFGDILPYPDLATLEVKNPALKNKLYMLNNGEIYYYTGTEYKKISGGGTSGDSSGLIFNTISELNTFLTNESRLAGILATCVETEGVLYILSTDRSSWLPVNQGGGTIVYLINSEIW